MYCKVKNCRFPHSHATRAHRCGTCFQFGHGQVECGHPDQIAELRSCHEDFPHRCTMDVCFDRRSHTSAAHHCEYFGCGQNHSISECPIIMSEVPPVRIKCPICRHVSTNFGQIPDLENTCSICMEQACNTMLECGHSNMCINCLHKVNKSEYFVMPRLSGHDAIKQKMQDDLDATPGKVYAQVYGDMGSTFYGRRNFPGDSISLVIMCQDDWGQYRTRKDQLHMDKRGALYRFLRGYTRTTKEPEIS